MSLDLDIDETDLMSDWIPSHLLDPGAYNPINEAGSSTQAAIDVKSPQIMYDDEGSDSGSSIAHLQMIEYAVSPRALPTLPPKKTIPTPIKIPNPTFHAPRVQVIRSSSKHNSYAQTPATSHSRPGSPYSGEDISAVSGTTLARALIGNSYILSDERASKYRSGTSVLTRADSATLPRERNQFSSSPIRSGRFDEEGVPPVPSNADSVYIPPKNPRILPSPNSGRLLSPNAMDGDTFGPMSNGIHLEAKSPVPLSSSLEQILPASQVAELRSLPASVSPPSSSPPITSQPHRDSYHEDDHSTSDNRPQSMSETSTPSDYPTSDYPTSDYSSPQLPPEQRQSTRSSTSDNILDYYENRSPPPEPSPPHPHTPFFRPPFSPISEESSSQLSPPSPYVKKDKVARMSTLSGKFVLNSNNASPQPSPLSLTPQTPSRPSNALLTPPVQTQTPPPLILSNIFTRQRAGSIPNPIQVVRDPSDRTKYNITVDSTVTRPSSITESPVAASASDEYSTQTFPETPQLWSAGSMLSPGMLRHESAIEQMFPQTPLSPFGMGLTSPASQAGDGVHNLAQQLLTRAASSVRHTRPGADITRARTVAAPNPATMGVHMKEQPEEEKAKEEEKKNRTAVPSWISQHFSDMSIPSSATSSHHNLDYSPEIPPAMPPLPAELKKSSSNSSSPLPQLPPSPPDDSPSPTPLVPDGAPSSLLAYASQSSQSLAQSTISSQSVQTFETTQTPTPIITPSGSTHSLNGDARGITAQYTTEHSSPPPKQYDTFADVSSIASPPPYYTLVFENLGLMTPSSGAAPSTSTSHSSHHRNDSESRNSQAGPSSSRNDHRNSKRLRNPRPGIPLGPRRPSEHQIMTRSSSGSHHHNRERNASVSSMSIPVPVPGRISAIPSLGSPNFGPRFQAPPMRWRGYTMDAAKWTFTSSHLQSLVSRAIKQSAEASFIRLLKLETRDEEIPNEMRRLEMQRTDIKSRYRMLARKRAETLARLSSAIEGTSQEDHAVAIHLVSKVSELSGQLDQLTEELHSVDEQISDLRSLKDVHDASALAMALRKLNTSFLKQVAISDNLRKQVESLEAERDDAWKQAESVAADFDHLTERIETPNGENRSNRSSRVMAMRKSSIRVSKAGLRSSSRRSSIASNRLSTSTLSGVKSTFSIEDAPPVPPIPISRNRPTNIMTDFKSVRSSTTGTSTDATPNTETRAMVQAHEELCDMLGITMEARPRRSRSAVATLADRRSPYMEPSLSRPASSRPLSMPDELGLTEVYNAMTADRKAMLATLEMLSDPA